MNLGVAPGRWNHAVAIVGAVGAGKSTHGLVRAVDLGKTPAYVLAYDPGESLPREPLPDGRRPHFHPPYPTLDAASAGLARRGGGVHVLGCPDLEATLAWVKAAGQSSRKTTCVPLVFLLDEGYSLRLEGLGATQSFVDLLLRRRHYHTGVIWTIQDPQLQHYGLLSRCTEIVMFRVSDDDALKKLRKAGVRDDALLARLPTLPDHRCETYRLGG